MSSIVVQGDTSGSVILEAPAVAGTVTVTLPATSGTMAVSGASQSFTDVAATGNLTVDGNTILGNASTDTLNVGNGGLVKDASGNVGIGTNSPAYKLDVSRGASDGFTAKIGRATGTAFYMYSDTFNSYLATDTSLNNAISLNPSGNYISLITNNGTEKVRIDSSGNLLVGASSSTWLGSLLKSGGTITLASGASINLSSAVCGGAIVSVYVAGSGNGGLFYLNYSAVAAKITGDGAATDTGADFAVYKSAASHTSTLKNKSVSTQTFSVVVVAGQIS